MVNPKVDENDIFTCELVDYSNFEDEPVNSIGTYLNKWGYKMQEKGALENFFTVMDVIIEDEEEKEKLLNKLMKKMQR